VLIIFSNARAHWSLHAKAILKIQLMRYLGPRYIGRWTAEHKQMSKKGGTWPEVPNMPEMLQFRRQQL
jgi:hypothetical protein